MIEIGAYDAKTKLAELLRQVQGGERIMITKHHVPVAMLVPPPEAVSQSTEEVIQALLLFSKGKFLKGFSLKEMIQEGRE